MDFRAFPLSAKGSCITLVFPSPIFILAVALFSSASYTIISPAFGTKLVAFSQLASVSCFC
jgi:hypothetical protein